MIIHQLRFRFRNETTEEQKAEVLALMRRTAAVDSVSFGTVGRHLGDPEAGYTHAYCVGIADLAALEEYMHDPVHLDGDPRIIPHFERLVIGPDLSDDPDPELGAKIMALHQRKVEMYPEWARQMETIPEVRIA
ncbi:Dabb family protein [Nocardia sp. NPDC127579]|uniref:Dabb family protein n=1 Tax=Nocardia sp. NPDC127579 TaxID=3345402 RepID=UPI00363F5B5B